MPSRGKLPPPPGSRSRPLPPEPSPGSNDAPPPLPSRPGTHKAPTMRLPPTPQQESPESSEDEGVTYEEADVPSPPVPRYLPPEPVEQETYDEFEGMGSPSHQALDDDPGETYDACDIQTESSSGYPAQEDNIYEEGDTFPEPPDGDLYEFMPEQSAPPIVPHSAPPMHNRTHDAPNLPSRPPPTRQHDTETSDSAPDLPGRPSAMLAPVKRISGDGQKSMGICLHELGARKANLKKVESREERDDKTDSSTEATSGDSFKDKINLFKQVEKDDSDSDDEPQPGNNFLSQISQARGSLKKSNAKSNNYTSLPKQPMKNNTQQSESSVSVTDTANLTIQQRIALMKGKSAGGVEFQATSKPKPPVKPNLAGKPNTPFKPMKPQTNQFTSNRSVSPHQGNDQSQKNHDNTSKSASHFQKTRQIPQPPIKPSKITPSSPNSTPRNLNTTDPRQMQPVPQKTPEVKSPPPVPSPTIVREKTPPLPPPPASSYEESDDIYDEGFSFMPDPLNKEEWYHGEIERSLSTQKLQSIGQDGTFMVRKSKQGGDNQPYTLVVLYQGHVYNLKMRMRNDGQIALGEEKPDELAFKDVPALIHHHKAHDVILVNVKEHKQHKTLLKKHPISMNSK